MIPDPSAVPGVEASAEDWNGVIAETLTRVLASAAFAGSERSRAFLAYVVTETLAGRGDRLSERTVGRRALDHGAAFDGRTDASVRVRATRVRKALRAYVEGEGAADLVRIDLPTGRYTPTFSRAPTPHLAGRTVEPAVLVMLFDAAGEGAALAATAVCEALVGQLARFPGLRVLGPATARVGDAQHIGRQLGARYVLQGSALGTGDVLRLSARVTDAESGEFVWAVAETLAREPHQLWALVDGWVAEVAGELGDYAGVLLPRSAPADDPDAEKLETAARLAFYTYVAQGTNASLLDARQALALARESGTRAPDVLAMYANTLAVTAAYGLSEDPDADLADAEATAREALAVEPRNAHAHLDLGTVALARGQWEVAIQRAQQGARLGAGHPTMLATAGTLLSLAGAWAEGVQVMREALRLNPSHPGYMHGLLALDRVLVGDDAAALAEASLIHAPDAYWGPFYRALALAGLGYLDQAHQELAAAVLIEPTLLEDPQSVLGSYANFSESQMSVLVDRVALIRGSGEPPADPPSSDPTPLG